MMRRIATTLPVLLHILLLPHLSSVQSISINRSFALRGTNFTVNCAEVWFDPRPENPYAGFPYLWPVDSTHGNTKESSVLISGYKPNDNEPRPIRGAPSNEWYVYNTNRFAVSGFKEKWGYRLPVQDPGLYSCSVQFAELNRPVKAGERVFDLEINAERGSKSFKSIDVKAAVPYLTALTKTASALAVTRYIDVLVQTKHNSKYGAIINGITCLRTGNLPADVPPSKQAKVDRRKITIAPIIRPNRISDRVVHGSKFTLDFGYFLTIRNGETVKTVCSDPPLRISDSTLLSEAWYLPMEKFTTSELLRTSLGFVSCYSIIGASSAIEDYMLRTNRALNSELSSLDIIIPITQSGIWQCDLLFAEIDPSVKTSGTRVFDVQVQDQMLLNYDILEFTLNGTYTKHVLTFFDVPAADILSIRLLPIQGKKRPVINALTCSLKKPMSRATVTKLIAERQLTAGNNPKACVQRPEGHGLFINSGGPKLCDIRGEPYGWILGGLDKSDPLRLTDERMMQLARSRNFGIYLTSRVGKHWYRGKWGYKIPVQKQGVYVVELHFAELVAGIRKGDRVFNIQVVAGSGPITLSNIDVFNSASYLSPQVMSVGPIYAVKYIYVYVQKSPSSKYGGLVSAIRVYQPVS